MDIQENNILLSIVVLAYNSEKYIAKCLDSLCNQDCANTENLLEVIITDDGSTDSTGNICDEYAAKFPFVHVIHTENHGTSYARNVAIPTCKGKFITFCDSDDFVSPHLLSVIKRASELSSETDMFVFRFFTELPAKGWPSYDIGSMKIDSKKFTDGDKLLVKAVSDNRIGGFTWNKVTKREFVQSVPFNANMSVLDDHWWVVKLLTTYKNMRVYCLDCYLYCYVQHPTFGQTRVASRAYKPDGMSWAIICIEDELKFDGLSPVVAEQLRASIYATTVGVIYENRVHFSDEVKAKMQSYLKQYVFGYYFRSKHVFVTKVKTLVKRLLSLLHMYKYRQ